MVLCAQDRARTKYEAECVNAREAVNRMAAVEEEQRKHEFDRQSERKRQALRRTQQAVADARRHAAEMQILREEAAYLSQFSAGAIDGNVDPSVQDDMSGLERTGPTFADPGTAFGGNEPGIVLLPDPSAASSAGTGSEIDSIRQELKRRQDSSQ